MANNKLHNPSIEGIEGLKGLNRTIKEEDLPIKIPKGQSAFKQYVSALEAETPTTKDVGYVGVNDSILDRRITSMSDLQDLEEFRGRTQSEIGQIVNGVTKGAVLAGTTFLDGTIGSIVGLIQGFKNLADKDENTGFWQGLWQNEFSQAMNDINKGVEDIFKNYYTQDELKNPLAARNIFSGNFIGDKFLKNIGFTIGAYYSGKAFTSMLNATKIPSAIGSIAKSTRAPKMIMSGTGAVASAFNEGRIMALEDSNNWRTLQEEQALDRYKNQLAKIESLRGMESYNIMANRALEQYNKELKQIEVDQAKMGNLEMFANVPLLVASNLFEFGKLYANGFKTARKLRNLNPTKFDAIAKGVGSGLAEGFEEVAQGAISNISGLGYEQDVMNFVENRFNPEAEKQTIDWMKAVSTGLNDTFNDSATLEEFLIGSLTGLLGMPVFGKANTSQAWLGKDKSIGLAGGIGGAISDYNEEKERVDKIVAYVNDRIANDKNFKNYYQGLIRHSKYQNDMDKAVILGDSKDFKNAEFNQLLSDIMMFDNAGKIKAFMTLIDSTFDTSDENLETIIDNTTTVTEEGKKHGPFIDSNGNKLTSTPEGKAKMIEQLTKSKDEMVNTIKEYIKIKDEIDLRSNEVLSDDELESLTGLNMQILNWRNRIKEMHPEIVESFKTIQKDFKAHRESANYSEEELKPLLEVEEAFNKMLESSPETLAAMLDSKDFIDGIFGIVEPLISNGESTLNISDLNELTQKLQDIKELYSGIKKHTIKFNSYMSNPESLKKDLDDTYKKIERRYEDSKIEEHVSDLLKSAKDIKTLKETIKSIPESRLQKVIEKAGEVATEEQMQVFQNYEDLENIKASFGEFDLSPYSAETANVIANNVTSILEQANSKEDIFNAFNTLKETIKSDTSTDNTEIIKAIDELLKHFNEFLEKVEKAADAPVETPSAGGIFESLRPTGEVAKGSDKSLLEDYTTVSVEGDTREVALQNAIDKTVSLAHSNPEMVTAISNEGVTNATLTPEDQTFIKNAAKELLEETTNQPEDKARELVDSKMTTNQNDSKTAKHTKKELSSSAVTEYNIFDGQKKKRKIYTPTNESLIKIQSFLKENGAYNLISSGEIGILNSNTKNGIDINFITNKEYPNTTFLATEVTESFRKTVKTSYSPIVIDGKEYAILGVLKNNSSTDYSDIIEIIKEETSEQTSSWKVAKSTTKIKQFYSGRMVTSDDTNKAEERNLSSILTGKKLGTDYGFIIVYKNETKYIGVDPSTDEVTPLNTYLPENMRNGSLWIMSRGSNGVWYPHYVAISRTGEVNWGNIKFFDNIRKNIKTLVSENSLESKLQAKLTLNKLIFFPDGNKLSFGSDYVSIGGTKVNKVDYPTEIDYINAVVDLLKSKNLRFQVSSKNLTETTTREDLIEAGIIKSDLLQLEHINGSFDIYPLGEKPKETSTEHTGSRKVYSGSRTNIIWFGNQKYNEYLGDNGEIIYTYTNGTIVTNQSVYDQLRVLSAVSAGNIAGVELENSTIYAVEFNGKKYHLEKPKQGPLKFINAQTYGRKLNKQEGKKSLQPKGNASEIFNTPTTTTESSTQTTDTTNSEETKKEIETPKKKPLSRKERLEAMKKANRNNSDSNSIETLIRNNQPAIMQIAKDAGYTGSLSTDVLKGLFEENNIAFDTIKDEKDLLDKIEYILNCKQN